MTKFNKPRPTKTHAPQMRNMTKRTPHKLGHAHTQHQNTLPPPKGQLIWGHHAVVAVLKQQSRDIFAVYATTQMAEKIKSILQLTSAQEKLFHIGTSQQLSTFMPANAAHQGIAIACGGKPAQALSEVLDTRASQNRNQIVLVLDQITDPQNVGAIFRLACGFDVKAIIMQNRHAPELAGACAKVAVGATEYVPHCLVTNIADTLAQLKEHNWLVSGLAGNTDDTIENGLARSAPYAQTPYTCHAVVLGAEGAGLRNRVKQMCDQILSIPMLSDTTLIDSLNVAHACAIALYEIRRQSQAPQ